MLEDFGEESEQAKRVAARNKLKKTGVLETFSCLDGRAPYPEGCSEETFWNVDKMEDVIPLVKPAAVEEWINSLDDYFEKEEITGRAKAEYQDGALAHAREYLSKLPAVTDKIAKDAVKQAFVLDKDKHSATKEELQDMEKHTYNVENLWRMTVCELIFKHFGMHMQVQDRMFELCHQMGRLHCGWLRGLFELFSALGWPLVLRVYMERRTTNFPRYYLVLDVVCVLNVVVMVHLDRLEMGADEDPASKDFFGKARAKAAEASGPSGNGIGTNKGGLASADSPNSFSSPYGLSGTI